MKPQTAIALVIVLSVVAVRCGRQSDTVTGPTGVSPDATGTLLTMPAEGDAPELPIVEPSIPEIFVGAGDIGLCTGDGNPEATASLLDRIGGTVFTLGDNAQVLGTQEEFRDCYGPTWGRHKHRTRPSPGNHDYEAPGALPYYDYFGMNAGRPGAGYYSFDLGAWHIVALNSNIPVSAGSAQGSWLQADLSAHRARCTLAYWHHPRYSSGPHGDQGQMRDFWQILHAAGADVVLSGHDHTYERFAPQDADGLPDAAHGIRQFVVGTGGARLYEFTALRPNSEVRIRTLGVLKLTLSAGQYDWEFVTVQGAGDFGTASCH